MEDKGETKDRTSTIRSVVGKWMAICFTVFVIYAMATLRIQELKQLSLFLSFTLALGFILHPLDPKKPDSIPFLVLDLLLAGLSFSIASYIWIEYWDFITRVGIPTNWDIGFSILNVFLILEATRRSAGLPLIIIASVFLLYALFGQWLPTPLSHQGFDLERITTTLFMTKTGIFGAATKVMAHFIFLFIVFGAFFGMCGGTQFFIDLASSIFGKSKGGPAKIAIAVSGLTGTISGTAVGNTVMTGTFTIPLMKRIGFEAHVAGAVEAAASTGGALMPPVMGAAAFVMAEFLGIPYLSVCKAALIPAILYYLAIFSIVHFYSLKIVISGLPEREIPSIKEVLYKKWTFIVPLLVLITAMVKGYSPRFAVLYALLATVVVSAVKRETRMTPSKILKALATSGHNSVMVGCTCATAGIIIGIVLMTGMGMKITSLVLILAGENLIIALFFVMLASLLFGMGLPTLVCYFLLAATVAPSLVNLGLAPLTAHLFIFYFGMLSMCTPPVAMAAYAAAAIAKTDPMKTGFVAWTFALAGFLLPYMFVYNNSLLLMGSPLSVIPAIFTSVIGVVCLGASVIGYLITVAMWKERVLLLAAALFLIKPGLITDTIGLLCAALAVTFQLRAKFRKKDSKLLPEMQSAPFS